ncbi:glucose-1-phosphate cytidylyltransferase [Desulfuromusa kysingii]|uniref:Glucose-1-phosphate cytidylyltransferase n=1 Tax=Desulfuromusa kysingii TaxID=37625 RepID=A0A1H4B9T5_9BACT|nr:sugar phosphate nucleotidyltransferase [Desulfuromusa kysingii]SEA44877.1 glucose-1-phosphate cytidylyltransferase [Desulfuromusa kysingii]
MKVVLFCGGQGMRLREYSEKIPKPMVPLGYRPILWNVMRYYAYYGHKDFILCLGHMADTIKKYFVEYDETISNDFVYTKGGQHIEMLNTDIDDWRITFVDTGINSNIGMRLMQVKEHLEGEEMFLANYSDGLSDLNLNTMIEWFKPQTDKVASFTAYQPSQSFHVVTREGDGLVNSISHIGTSGLYINTGYFVLRSEIFDYLKWGEELVEDPFQRLIAAKKLTSWEHKGFWASMDTYKDKQTLDEAYAKGGAPWEVWLKNDKYKVEGVRSVRTEPATHR